MTDGDWRTFVARHGASLAWQDRVHKSWQDFDLFCRRDLFISADEASSDDLCAYALHRFRADGWLASTVRAAMSAIDNRRHALGLSRLQSVDTTRRLLQAMRKARPAGNEYAGVDAFAPADLISALLPANTFYGLRQRTLFTGRAVTLARSDSFLNIRRSTIRDTRDLARRPVVVFVYTSKNATAAGRPHDNNYVEHLSCCARAVGDDVDADLICPACLMLALKRRVDVLPLASSHDKLFTSAEGKALAADTLRNIISGLMSRAELDSVYTSHDLRGASNQTLQVLGVSWNDINIRAAWHSKTDSTTRSLHYTRNRFVKPNFADLLLLPSIISASASQRV